MFDMGAHVIVNADSAILVDFNPRFFQTQTFRIRRPTVGNLWFPHKNLA